MISDEMLPSIFIGLTGLSILVYAILDGYDLGVGMLLPLGKSKTKEKQRDKMIASIGPFWDANETWLVLAVGLTLIAFPSAHALILKSLYIPATIMLGGLILRGVAFDFRAKARMDLKDDWDKVFKLGSLITALAQGYMLGRYVLGFEQSLLAYSFSIASSFGVVGAYCFIGSSWLVMKTQGDLQKRSIKLAKIFAYICLLGIALACLINPILHPQVFAKWFSFPFALAVLPIPIFCMIIFIVTITLLNKMPLQNDVACWFPFTGAALIFVLCFQGIAISFYPYIVPNQLTIWETASAPSSLRFLLNGALVVIPCILAYTAFSYRVFWGKVDKLTYY